MSRPNCFFVAASALAVIHAALLGVPPARADGSPQPAGSVVRATLPNGLRVIAVRSPLAPVVTTVVNYLVGSVEAPAGFPGMAHAQEHMMFRGSPDLSAAQLADVTAAMGGRFNAGTSQTVTQYFLTVPAEDLDLALHLEAVRMRAVLDSQELWEKERGAIEQEVAQDLSNPEYLFYEKVVGALFAGSTYAHTPLGTRPSFDKTTGAMLQAFHRDWYAPNNAILVIAGDVDPPAAIAKAGQLFGEIEAKRIPRRPSIRLGPVVPATFQLKTDRPYGLVAVAFRFPGTDSADFAAATVLQDALGSQRGELFALVPQGKALFTEFSVDSLPAASVAYALAAFPKAADASTLVAEVREALAAVKTHGIADDMVEAAKRRAITKAELEKNSVSDLAMRWSDAVAVEGRNSPDEDLDAIRRVTPADVNRVARRYLDLGHAVVAVLAPQASGKPTSSASFGGKESFAPEKTESVPLPDWAASVLHRASVPPSSLHPSSIVLPNGLEVIVQPESISRAVMVLGHVKTEPALEAPKGKEGVDEAMAKLFSFGTQSLDRLAFQRALDDIGADETAGVDFSVHVLAERFDRGVELLADHELHPARPEQAFRIVQRQLAMAVAGRLESPDYLDTRAVRKALLPAADPALREATPETVQSLTPADVDEYRRRVLRPELTKIVVIGDVTPRQVEEVFTKYFGRWTNEGPRPDVDLPPVPANVASSVVVPDSSRVQSKATLAQTLGLVRSDPDYYALELGNHVLGGAFYATRLYRDLREQTGLVYYVSSGFQVRKTRSFYGLSFGCDPPNVSRTRAIVVRDLERMRADPVDAGELDQAKALLLREIPLSESSAEEIARGLLSRATDELPLDEPTQAAHRYLALTAEQVRAAFAKWLRPQALVEVTQGPAPR
jgi:zinc protease